MSQYLVSKTKIDPYFYEFIVTTNQLEDIKEDLIDPVVAEFKAKGYGIMVLGEPQDDKHFRISAFACQKNKAGSVAAVSDSAEAFRIAEKTDFQGLASSNHEPTIVSFEEEDSEF